MTPGEHPTVSVSSAKVFQRQAVALHGLDDLRDDRLPLGHGIPFCLGKEGAGLLQQIPEAAVGQRILPGWRRCRRSAVSSVGTHFHVGVHYPEVCRLRVLRKDAQACTLLDGNCRLAQPRKTAKTASMADSAPAVQELLIRSHGCLVIGKFAAQQAESFAKFTM